MHSGMAPLSGSKTWSNATEGGAQRKKTESSHCEHPQPLPRNTSGRNRKRVRCLTVDVSRQRTRATKILVIYSHADWPRADLGFNPTQSLRPIPAVDLITAIKMHRPAAVRLFSADSATHLQAKISL